MSVPELINKWAQKSIEKVRKVQVPSYRKNRKVMTCPEQDSRDLKEKEEAPNSSKVGGILEYREIIIIVSFYLCLLCGGGVVTSFI